MRWPALLLSPSDSDSLALSESLPLDDKAPLRFREASAAKVEPGAAAAYASGMISSAASGIATLMVDPGPQPSGTTTEN